jgi:hypothetical protein
MYSSRMGAAGGTQGPSTAVLLRLCRSKILARDDNVERLHKKKT